MRAEFWMLVHPGDSELLSGITNEIFKRVRPNDYRAVLDSDNRKHCQQFGRWLAEKKIDVLGHRIKTLVRFQPGFQSKQTEKIFKELQATQIEKIRSIAYVGSNPTWRLPLVFQLFSSPDCFSPSSPY